MIAFNNAIFSANVSASIVSSPEEVGNTLYLNAQKLSLALDILYETWNRKIDQWKYNKYFLVRFDDGDVIRWNYLEAADQSSDIIFISNEKKFKEKLTNSSNIYLTVNLYQDGQRTFIFDVKGLKKEFR